MTYSGPLHRAVSVAVGAIDAKPQDEAAVVLARRYAMLIDDAAPEAKYTKHLRGLRQAIAMLASVEPLAASQAEEHFEKIADALSAHSVASDLGPKLLAVLTALGMTPAGRGVKGGEVGGAGIAGRLDEFTARRTGQHPS